MDKDEIDRRLDNALQSREFKDAQYNLVNFLEDCRLFVLNGKNDEKLEVMSTRKNIAESPAVLRTRYKSVFSELCGVLSSMGVPEKLTGFRLLCDCIMICSQGLSDGKRISLSELQKKTGKDFGLSQTDVERLCRYALARAAVCEQTREKYPFLNTLGVHPTVKKTVFVVAEFLAENYDFKGSAEGLRHTLPQLDH